MYRLKTKRKLKDEIKVVYSAQNQLIFPTNVSMSTIQKIEKALKEKERKEDEDNLVKSDIIIEE